MSTGTPVLEIEGLKTVFHTDDGVLPAVNDLTLKIGRGETLGLVGESGSGKSVTSLSIMRLLPEASSKIASGKITYLGKNLVQLPESQMRKIRGGQIGMIFQEPGTSLNPVFRVGKQVTEAIQLHQKVSSRVAKQRTLELFREVGIPEPERRFYSFPHEMSGGQKQRVMIALALSCNPELLIADEPTTALDVTIQNQILDLLRQLQDQRGMSILFITHDLGVIAEIADRVAVMFRGKLVEEGPIETIFRNPQHPYTKGLLACRPRLESKFRRLPTVSDFMDAKREPDGSYLIREKAISQESLLALEQAGRGRLLHPRSELVKIGHPPLPEETKADTRYIPESQRPLLTLDDLKIYYPIRKGILRTHSGDVKAVDGVSLKVYRGQTLGLVGESGCGKTTTGRAIVKLANITSGKILYDGVDISSFYGEDLQRYRSKIQIIFQDPYSSLNPRMTIESMITEAMKIHGIGSSKSDRRDRTAQLLIEVGLEAAHLLRYPHEFSGGQRQRISIARSLAVEPEFLICDESVSALDVSVQAQVLNLLKNLQEKRNLTYVFISHDLSVVKFMSDMMAVMNGGKIMEFGPSESIYANPQHEYTKRLISSIPDGSFEKIMHRARPRSV
ncbi:ABC transporter ATP-binding protein [Planctomicrobium sp. SH668]|uniref:ABC transporter ATP-binding protein n=1 Tax=Planctomicrobium sp. SH668 TaxID=3448126 RepID=UPI003F5C28B4